MGNLTKSDKHTIRFLKWTRRHSGLWYLVCTPGDEHMDLGMMKKLVKLLAKEQFYEMIFVLLMVHRNAKFMDSIFKTMLLEMIIAGWKGEVKNKEKILQDLTDFLT